MNITRLPTVPILHASGSGEGGSSHPDHPHLAADEVFGHKEVHPTVPGQTGDVEGPPAVNGSEADLGGNRDMTVSLHVRDMDSSAWCGPWWERRC